MSSPRTRRLPPLVFLVGSLLAACGSSESDAQGRDAGGSAGGAASGDLVAVPGTGVRLVPPPGFVPAENFSGFMHVESTTSILVMEIPGPYSEASAGFSSLAKLAARGMKLLDSEERPMGGHPGLLLRLSQTSQGVHAEKWGWIFGTEEKSAMITGTCLDEEFLPVVRASILSARWDPERVFDASEGLGFELADPAGLQLWQRTGNMLVYSADGQPDLQKAGKPLLLVGPSLGGGAVEDRRAFAEERLRQFPLREVQVRSVEPLEIDGLPGFALAASGLEEKTGAGRFAYLAVLFPPEGYWLAYGSCASEHEAEYLPVFQRAAASLRRSAGD